VLRPAAEQEQHLTATVTATTAAASGQGSRNSRALPHVWTQLGIRYT
jgi:hypothetical protein